MAIVGMMTGYISILFEKCYLDCKRNLTYICSYLLIKTSTFLFPLLLLVKKTQNFSFCWEVPVSLPFAGPVRSSP